MTSGSTFDLRSVTAQTMYNPLFAPAKIEVSAAWGYAMGKVKELLLAPDEVIEDELSNLQGFLSFIAGLFVP